MSKELDFIEKLLQVGSMEDVDILCRERRAELITAEEAKRLSRVSRGKRVMVKLNFPNWKDDDSSLVREVEGIPVGEHFAVFKDPNAKGWQVCHVPSGMRACLARVKRDALVYGAQIARVEGVHWSQEDPMSGVDKAPYDLLVAISRRANSWAAPLNSFADYLD